MAIVTFFRNHAKHQGESWRFDVTRGNGERIAFFTYTVKPFSEDLRQRLAKSSARNQDELERLHASLINEVSKLEGGIIVRLLETAEAHSFLISKIPTTNFRPPGQFVHLRFGYAPRPTEISFNAPQELPVFSKILIPVDQEAQERLLSFLNHASWLGPDAEALVLDSLARPNLESRVAALERRVEVGALSSTSKLNGLLRKLTSSVSLRLVVIVIGVLVLLFLGLKMVVPQFRVSGLSKAVDEFNAEFGSIPDSDNIQKTKDHFITKSGEDALKEETFALGIVKLLALLHDPHLQLTDEELGAKRGLNITKKMLEHFTLDEISISELHLLGYVTCNAFEENHRKGALAGIGAIKGGDENMNLKRVNLPIACDEIKNRQDLAEIGLRDLTKRLDERIKQ